MQIWCYYLTKLSFFRALAIWNFDNREDFWNRVFSLGTTIMITDETIPA